MVGYRLRMKAIQITAFGGPEVMKYTELPDPIAGESEVVLDITSVGINYADTHQTENSYLSPQTLPMVPGIEVTGGLKNYLVIALVLALINATLGTLLKILTLPLAFLSLGFSLLVVNTAMLLITDRISENMTITGFWSAFFGAILISIISSMITQITTKAV